MYNLEILPIAKKDIDDIIYYISNTLKNRSAAEKLANKFSQVMDDILEFPYGCLIYNSLKKLKYDYRCIRIKNFLMIYTINEEEKIITISRVLYEKMDIKNILE